MPQVSVELGERSYVIDIAPGLLHSGRIAEVAPHTEIMVVTDDQVGPLYLEGLVDQLGHARVLTQHDSGGRGVQKLASVEAIWGELMQARFSRKCCLIALGGGVIGDMTGFAAACYQRGVDFVQIPTTLLAQVDSSVGGKTAVNHPQGKNMIGAFYQPKAVIIDTDTLSSLPKREWAAGMAEVIKYGALGDSAFLDWLETNMDALNEKARSRRRSHTSFMPDEGRYCRGGRARSRAAGFTEFRSHLWPRHRS